MTENTGKAESAEPCSHKTTYTTDIGFIMCDNCEAILNWEGANLHA